MAHSLGTWRLKLTADVRGWEPRHPTVFDVCEAAQSACIDPLYEPPTPMVLTSNAGLTETEKDFPEVAHSSGTRRLKLTAGVRRWEPRHRHTVQGPRGSS